jgi:hypothetical protein
MVSKAEKPRKEQARKDEEPPQQEDWRDEEPGNFKGPLQEVDDQEDEELD